MLPRSRWLGALALAGAALGGTAARAENHALILWIGEYADPKASLPGIDLDAKRARQMALAMNVPAANVVEKKNQQLTLKGMGSAIDELTQRIKPGDKVFMYYSGHGAQRTNTGGGKPCSEGLVSQDLQLYIDRDLEAALARLGAKASQVVMFNDSCFSGGAATKGLPQGGRQLVPKAWTGALAKADPAARACGDAVNKGVLAKTFEVVQQQGANVLYVAAARDNEVSYASSEGSLATEAWAACLADPAADTDHSGSISGEELRVCAQRQIDANAQQVSQHISLVGTASLPVSSVAAGPHPATASAAASTTAAAAAAATAVNAPNALRDLSVGADRSWKLTLQPTKKQIRIGQDALEFDVEVDRPGYLYIFQVGSDGKTFNLLFPNQADAANQVAAGTQHFPRAGWSLRSAGPPGPNSLMVLLSPTPKDFSAQMTAAGTYASAPATRSGAKALVLVATGAESGGSGRYGTSAVVTVTEVK